MGNFAKCYQRTRIYEGGNDDDPRDPGGRTSRGILQREYDRYRDTKALPRGDVWRASEAEIEDIYRTGYWARVHGDDLPAGVDLCIWDAAVNSGVSQAAKWVQRALGITVDGDFGPATLAAIKGAPDHDALIADICSRRLGMLQGLKTWPHFGKGWSARVRDVLATAQAWASGSVGPEPTQDLADLSMPKAKPEQIAAPAVTHDMTGTITVIGGLGTAVAGGVKAVTDVGQAATDAAAQLQPVAYISPKIAALCAFLTVVGVVAGIYVSWQHRRHQALLDGRAIAKVEG